MKVLLHEYIDKAEQTVVFLTENIRHMLVLERDSLGYARVLQTEVPRDTNMLRGLGLQYSYLKTKRIYLPIQGVTITKLSRKS